MIKYEQNREVKTVKKLTLEQKIKIVQENERLKYEKIKDIESRRKYKTPGYMLDWTSNIIYFVRKAQLVKEDE